MHQVKSTPVRDINPRLTELTAIQVNSSNNSPRNSDAKINEAADDDQSDDDEQDNDEEHKQQQPLELGDEEQQQDNQVEDELQVIESAYSPAYGADVEVKISFKEIRLKEVVVETPLMFEVREILFAPCVVDRLFDEITELVAITPLIVVVRVLPERV